MHKKLDLTGQRYGRLVVLGLAYTKQENCGNITKFWLCKCDCGNTKIVRMCCLRNGTTSSCGCYSKELVSKRNATHRMSKTTLYKAWSNMKARCYNKNRSDYSEYGGRGIKVCEEWNVFENFKTWALENGFKEEKPHGKNLLSLDRINVDGDYEPSNCRWATDREQANNKRNNTRFFYNGKNLTAREWSEITGINFGTLVGRLHNPRWTIERALTEPVHKYKQKAN